jgi:hypothetical protein
MRGCDILGAFIYRMETNQIPLQLQVLNGTTFAKASRRAFGAAIDKYCHSVTLSDTNGVAV